MLAHNGKTSSFVELSNTYSESYLDTIKNPCIAAPYIIEKSSDVSKLDIVGIAPVKVKFPDSTNSVPLFSKKYIVAPVENMRVFLFIFMFET
jgi:hypothetical protein